jgi:hypothetical protein
MFSFSDTKVLRGDGGVIRCHRHDDVTTHFLSQVTVQTSLPPEPLLALSLRNLVHSIADLHRAGSIGAGADLHSRLWHRFRPLIAVGGHMLRPDEASFDWANRRAICERRQARAARYRSLLCHAGFTVLRGDSGEAIWRLPLLAADAALARRATRALRTAGLPASNHYFPLNRLFGGPTLPCSEAIGDRILNVWLDDKADDETIDRSTAILNAL